MRSTTDSSAVSSLLDVRRVPLAEMPTLDTVALGNALARVLPEDQSVVRVLSAEFNSAI
jgi:FXSXX-COOH protein